MSLPDQFLVGENTHHAYLLAAEFGSRSFPQETGAIGRAWLEDGVITGVGFDYGTLNARGLALERLQEWAAEEGYTVDPDLGLDEPLVGLSGYAPDAFVYQDGQLYFGSDHVSIVDMHNLFDNPGVYGRIYQNYDGTATVEVYSDFYYDRQSGDEIDAAVRLLKKKYPNITTVQVGSLVEPDFEESDFE